MASASHRLVAATLILIPLACIGSAPQFSFPEDVPPTPDGGAPDAPPGDAGCDPNAPFRLRGTQPFENVNTAADQLDARLSDDELTLYFATGDYATGREGGLWRLAVARRPSIGSAFGRPTQLPNIAESGAPMYSSPTLTKDRKRIYYQCGDSNVWRLCMSRRDDEAKDFGAPEPVTWTTFDQKIQYLPFVDDRHGKVELWFTAGNHGAELSDIYRSTEAEGGNGTLFNPPSHVDELSLPNNVYDNVGALSADGRTVFYTSGDEMWTATRENVNAKFGARTALEEGLNSDVSRESVSWVSPDGCRVYFHSTRAGGKGNFDLYVAERAGYSNARVGAARPDLDAGMVVRPFSSGTPAPPTPTLMAVP